MQSNLSIDKLKEEISEAELFFKQSFQSMSEIWLRSKVKPSMWSQNQYEAEGEFWVVAIIGQSCLYYNPVEEGWGWGEFSHEGIIEKYHYEQDTLDEAFRWHYEDQRLES